MVGDIKITSRYGDGDYLSKNKDWHVEDSPWKASQIDKIIHRNNLKVHTYTSPHLIKFNERIRINSHLISNKYLSDLLEECEKKK